jgi:hypothetical protein
MQQQPSSQQQPAAQIQPGQIPTQFTGYVNPAEQQQHTGNPGAFIYNTNQRISIPHQGQAQNQVPPGAAQAGSHHAYSNQQYMYQQQYAGQMNYYDPNMVAQQYINTGAAYTSQAYIYAHNPNVVNMYNPTSNKHFLLIYLFVLKARDHNDKTDFSVRYRNIFWMNRTVPRRNYSN